MMMYYITIVILLGFSIFFAAAEEFQVDDQKLGCFVVPEDILLNNMKFQFINYNTPRTCSVFCYNVGYQFAGVTDKICLCHNHAPENNLKVADTECNISCPGDSNYRCGGKDRIHTFDLTKLIKRIKRSNSSDTINRLDEFETLNLNFWSPNIYIAQEPDFEFVVYNNSRKNVYTENGELVIKPTILSDEFVRRGHLILTGCTKNRASSECNMKAKSYNIIPPIISSKITTKNSFSFLYGKLEIIAKLPTGDWIVSEMALVSKTNEKNKLILATSNGNANLKCNGIDESAAVVKYGLKIDEKYDINSIIMKSTSENRWSDDYHSFVITRTHENVEFEIDGQSQYMNTSNLLLDLIFDSEYYISLGVSVGGMTNFHDDCLSNGFLKPWKNFETKAKINFWKNKGQWIPTWSDDGSALRIESVNFTTLANID